MPTMSNREGVQVFNESIMNRMAIVEYKKILSALDIVTSRGASTAAGMKIFLEKIMAMLTNSDLIDPNYFGSDSSKAKRGIWNPEMCLQIACAMPTEAQELYEKILKLETKNEESLKSRRGERRWLGKEIMGVIARDALRSTIQNELEIAEKVAELENKRQNNIAKMMTENKMRRSFCMCDKRCIESYHGSCGYKTKVPEIKASKYKTNTKIENKDMHQMTNDGKNAITITIKDIMDDNGKGISITIPSSAR